MAYAREISFSGGIFPPFVTPIIVILSPDGTCLTIPRSHPDAAGADPDPDPDPDPLGTAELDDDDGGGSMMQRQWW